MSNITLSVDDAVIRKVRKMAIDKHTTLTEMVRTFLESVASRDEVAKQTAVAELNASFRELSRGMGRHGWTRDELHER